MKAKYPKLATARCAMAETAKAEGLPGDEDGSAKMPTVADDLVINMGRLVNIFVVTQIESGISSAIQRPSPE